MPASRRSARASALGAALLVVQLAACAPRAATGERVAVATPEEVYVADRLYFGREIPGGGTVSEEEWAAFLGEVVTPRFPDGSTIWRAQGQWLDPRGRLVREAVFVLELFHRGGADADARVGAVASEYKARFRQDAVLRITAPVRLRVYE